MKRSYSKASRLGVAAGLVVLSVAHAGPALAAKKGDAETASGDIKIHNIGTGEDDNRNEPKVGAFTLQGFNFDANEELDYAFASGRPSKTPPS